jgi:hypothetical protein
VRRIEWPSCQAESQTRATPEVPTGEHGRLTVPDDPATVPFRRERRHLGEDRDDRLPQRPDVFRAGLAC